jgi:hypothetical protein
VESTGFPPHHRGIPEAQRGLVELFHYVRLRFFCRILNVLPPQAPTGPSAPGATRLLAKRSANATIGPSVLSAGHSVHRRPGYRGRVYLPVFSRNSQLVSMGRSSICLPNS